MPLVSSISPLVLTQKAIVPYLTATVPLTTQLSSLRMPLVTSPMSLVDHGTPLSMFWTLLVDTRTSQVNPRVPLPAFLSQLAAFRVIARSPCLPASRAAKWQEEIESAGHLPCLRHTGCKQPVLTLRRIVESHMGISGTPDKAITPTPKANNQPIDVSCPST